MGIYLPNMEMPESCAFCRFYGAYCYAKGDEDAHSTAPCPLVPVPPHGDLIDRDEYRDEFMNGVYALCSDDSDNYRANAIIDLFDKAPTVIPADKEEQM